ncbi:tyrosine-type recombinase/integrase [Kribbella sp. HUAS MG21]|uniref:Tyrosine-type recombinase/integrase n=1 Tax=Kribbella sp. HUAS MG21 TaxID=3160966 RepID=A0AAU7TJ22_9ACTN
MTTTPRRKRTRRSNGQGSVYQRTEDNLWVGAAYVLMPDGTRRRKVVTGKTEAVVTTKLRNLQARSDQGIPAEATNWTLEAFLHHWLEYVVKPSRKPKTHQGYEVVARVHIIPVLGRKKLHKLNGADVRMFMQRVANTCLCCLHGYDKRRGAKAKCCAVGRCCHKTPSDRLVEQIHSVLRNALQAAVREELVQRNVAKLVQVRGATYEVNRGLNADQARKLRVAAENNRLKALYTLALYLGLRRGELLGLRWEDVDLDNEFLEIRQTLQRVDGELRAVTPKTRRSRRTVPLIARCVADLREHQERQNRERKSAGAVWKDTGYVFTTEIGTPIEPDNLRRSWYPLRTAAGLDGVRLHDLRHSCVTLLLGLKVPPHIVQAIVGHANLDVTMTIYAHTSLDDKREALRKLQEHLA